MEKGLSRQDIADAVGVNPQTIGFIERGDYSPSLELAFKLAEFLKVDVGIIFSTKPFVSVFTQQKESNHEV
jgi:DNA-binding XRE family transcriptional regulator